MERSTPTVSSLRQRMTGDTRMCNFRPKTLPPVCEASPSWAPSSSVCPTRPPPMICARFERRLVDISLKVDDVDSQRMTLRAEQANGQYEPAPCAAAYMAWPAHR